MYLENLLVSSPDKISLSKKVKKILRFPFMLDDWHLVHFLFAKGLARGLFTNL